MKRLVDLGLCTALLLPVIAPPAVIAADGVRMTPVVRAVRTAKSSVVNIHSEKTTYAEEPVFGSSKGRKVNGMGTGIVLDERGYIVTNHHVVDGVDSLRVTLVDGGTYTARVVSYDRSHDLAVIKIESRKKLALMPLGTSSDLMLGETVIAVGNAYGYEHTVTKGIISALGRDVEVNETQSYENLIQTDASINPGNSGGPLLNLEGKVIGINVAIRAGAQRIGFAIPIDDARRVIARLMSVERLARTYHGLRTREVKTAKTLELLADGADPESPAAAAGLQPGDVIRKIDQVQVVDAVDLERALLGKKAGDSVDVVVERKGKSESLSLVVADARNRRNVARNDRGITVVRADRLDADTADKTWQTLGLKLETLPENERRSVGPRYRGGMQVLEVRKGGPAARNGIRVGDVLVGLHIWETVTADNVDYVLDHPKFGGFNPLKFYIVRKGETLYGHLRIAARP